MKDLKIDKLVLTISLLELHTKIRQGDKNEILKLQSKQDDKHSKYLSHQMVIGQPANK